MYQVKSTKAFRKDIDRCKKRGYDMSLVNKAIHLLEENGCLPASYLRTSYQHSIAALGKHISRATGCCGNRMTRS